MKKLYFGLVAVMMFGCGDGDTDSSGATALEGRWTSTECEIDSVDSVLSEMVFRGNQVTSLTTFFYNDSTCSSLDNFTITVNGSYLVSGSAITLLSGEEVLPIDLRFSTGGYSVSQVRADTLASQGTSLEAILLDRGFGQVDNLPVTEFFINPNFYTVYRQQGDTLAIGIDEAESNTSPGTRLTVLNETYSRVPSQPTQSSSTTLQGNAQVPGLSGVWYTGNINNANNNSVTFRNYLSFDDGKATSDIAGVMTNGVAQSQLDSPNKWYSYRTTSSGKLQLVYSDGGTFTPTFTTLASPAGNDQRYDGCWTVRNSTVAGSSLNGGAYGIAFSSRTYCFNTAGQYTTSSSSAFGTAGPNGSGGGNGADSEGAGNYRIDGHVLTLQPYSGESVRTSFGWYNFEGGMNMVIGSGTYLPN